MIDWPWSQASKNPLVFLIFHPWKLENNYNLISVFDDIKFTVCNESNNKIPYLNGLITRTDTGKLETQLYQKPVNTGRILHHSTNNRRTQKISWVQTLLMRAKTHCRTLAGQKNEEKYLMTILHKNSCPRDFIKN